MATPLSDFTRSQDTDRCVTTKHLSVGNHPPTVAPSVILPFAQNRARRRNAPPTSEEYWFQGLGAEVAPTPKRPITFVQDGNWQCAVGVFHIQQRVLQQSPLLLDPGGLLLSNDLAITSEEGPWLGGPADQITFLPVPLRVLLEELLCVEWHAIGSTKAAPHAHVCAHRPQWSPCHRPSPPGRRGCSRPHWDR